MSTLSQELRAILVTIYVGLCIAGIASVTLLLPPAISRWRRIGWRAVVDPVVIFMTAIIVMLIGMIVGRSYFLMTMRMVNEQQTERLAWWVQNLGTLAIIGQSLLFLGVLLLIHGYFVHSTDRHPWIRIFIHVALATLFMAGIVLGEAAHWWGGFE